MIVRLIVIKLKTREPKKLKEKKNLKVQAWSDSRRRYVEKTLTHLCNLRLLERQWLVFRLLFESWVLYLAQGNS